MVDGAVAFRREQGIPILLVDVTKVTGFAQPTLIERYWFVQEWAEEANGAVRIAMVARLAYIDPQEFGVTAALNAGLTGNIFASDSEALAGLLSLES